MRSCLQSALLLLLCANLAQALELGLGPRLGLSKGESSFLLGGEVLLSDFGITLVEPLRFKASLDLGWGKTGEAEKFKSLRMDLDLEYVLQTPSHVGQFYLLAGSGLFRQRPRSCNCPDDSEENAWKSAWGANLGAGFSYRHTNIEFTFGVANLPTLQITGAYTFGL